MCLKASSIFAKPRQAEMTSVGRQFCLFVTKRILPGRVDVNAPTPICSRNTVDMALYRPH